MTPIQSHRIILNLSNSDLFRLLPEIFAVVICVRVCPIEALLQRQRVRICTLKPSSANPGQHAALLRACVEGTVPQGTFSHLLLTARATDASERCATQCYPWLQAELHWEVQTDEKDFTR